MSLIDFPSSLPSDLAAEDPADVSSWETVLSAVEQDVRRTEALLVLAVADLTDPIEAEAASVAKQVMASTAATSLPPLELMPLVPPSLFDRLQALRKRITEVRGELESAMTANRKKLADTTTALRVPVAEPRPRYIDTVA
jgi:hypothetical protein